MNVSGSTGLKFMFGGLRNRILHKPLSLSFEITHSCTANCWHCNWGGPIKEERMDADGYAALAREMKPLVVNISGGEPLARGDIYEIIEKLANPGGLPWVVVVSNASNLNEDRYDRLKAAGMHQLSVSMDFPDDRHSEFRRIPGLFDKMRRTLPELAKKTGKGDVSLNVCITEWNFRDLPQIVQLADDWGLPVNFSVYSHLRVQNRDGLVTGDELDELKASIEKVIDMQKAGYAIFTSPRIMRRFYQFMAEGGIGGCQAGRDFLVVNPDGRMTPCAMVMAYFDKQQDMYNQFTKQNTCQACYISTRANTEKTAREYFAEHAEILGKIVRPWTWAGS
jgi:MoaA/NifB/PqqE/SkfB family radical SAM enzyme